MGFDFISLFVEKPTTDNSSKEEKTKAEKERTTISNNRNVSTDSIKITDVQDANTPTENTNPINTDILDKLCSYLESCDLAGPDYIDLRKAANSDAMKMIPDEAVRFQAAFATMKCMHPTFTKEIVLNSIDSYINEIRKQNDVAKSQIESKRKTEVDDKKVEIEKKQKRISELQSEITALATEVSKMTEEVNVSNSECNKNISEFETAVNIIINNLEADKTKISEKLVD